jgi:uncharacterized protein (UPF0332 family)
MVTEEERQSLIDYRINQADESKDLVQFLIANGKLLIAVNRIYYGMYYALTALALKHKFETTKHSQLIGWFNKEFILTGKADSKYGKILRNAFQNRTKGDYDAFISFSVTETESMLKEMADFTEKIKKFLKE